MITYTPLTLLSASTMREQIHRHEFWGQFIDRIEDSLPTILKTGQQHFCFLTKHIYRLINLIGKLEE